jgi:hypothetical protein
MPIRLALHWLLETTTELTFPARPSAEERSRKTAAPRRLASLRCAGAPPRADRAIELAWRPSPAPATAMRWPCSAAKAVDRRLMPLSPGPVPRHIICHRRDGRPACRPERALVATPGSRVSSAVEQWFCKPEVGGSIPSPGTTFPGSDTSRYRRSNRHPARPSEALCGFYRLCQTGPVSNILPEI